MRVARPLAGGVLVAASVALVAVGAHRPAEQGLVVALLAAGLAALLCGAVAGLAIVRPWWALLAWLAASPVINASRAELWIGELQLIPSTPLIAALGMGALLAPAEAGRAVPARGRATWLVLALGATLAIASTVAAPDVGTATNITLHGVLEPMALFAIVVALRPDVDGVRRALLALAGGVAVATAINLVWLAAVVAPGDLYEQRMQLARLTYFNVGIFATMLVVALPAVAIPILLRRPLRLGRPAVALAWLVIGVMLVALFLTYTKSAWLSAAVIGGLLVVLLVRGWRRRLALLLGVAALLAVGVPYPLPVLRAVSPDLAAGYESFVQGLQGGARLESWDPDTYEGSGSIGIRLEAVGAALELTAESPLLGVGPGGFAREFDRVRPDASVPGLQSAHNMLPNLAAEYGLPFALLVAIGVALLIGWTLASARRAPPGGRVVATVVAVALIGFVSMATLFGVDLYRTYRTMNTDVLTAALLAGLAWCLAATAAGRRSTMARPAVPQRDDPLAEPARLVAPGGEERLERRP
jgi:O-antigen ligase